VKLTGLLILLLSHQGFWIGGQQSTVTIRAAVEGGLPSADLSWELMLDSVKLGEGATHLNPGNRDVTINITPPKPRTRVVLQWIYRVTSTKDGKTLETGELPINLFPSSTLDGVAARARGRSIVVWDRPSGLPETLNAARISFTQIDDASKLLALKPDVILVGQGMLGDLLLEQSSLNSLASAGASVMIFQQTRPARVMQYPLQQRQPGQLAWRLNHPLLSGLSESDLQSLVDPSRDLWVLRIPTDGAALEIGYYPPQVSSRLPGPIDAVVMTQTVNRGRVVLCQIPLEDWATDPRSQLILRNTFDFLLTRPEPTPRPSERSAPLAQTQPAVSTIRIP
jgi:hypothetical protein